MKRRIMSRAEIAIALCNWQDQSPDGYTGNSAKAQMDLLFYFLADGDTVKIYNDRNMGGTVVEIKD